MASNTYDELCRAGIDFASLILHEEETDSNVDFGSNTLAADNRCQRRNFVSMKDDDSTIYDDFSTTAVSTDYVKSALKVSNNK